MRHVAVHSSVVDFQQTASVTLSAGSLVIVASTLKTSAQV